MDEDEIIMREVQDEIIGLLIKYPNHTLQALAMVLKMTLDCYVAALGKEDAEKILETAIDSVRNGKHSIIPREILKKSLH